MKNNNLLLVANYESGVGYAWGLMEKFWIAIANEFASNNRNIYLVFPKIDKINTNLVNSPIYICELDFSLIKSCNVKKIKHFIKSNNIGYIYLTSFPYYHINYIRLKNWGVKKIIHHDHSPGERPKVSGIKRIIKKLILSIPNITCDYYIGVSKFVYNRLKSNTCLPETRCTYVLNGITPYHVTTERTKYARDLFSIPYENKIIVNTGRAHIYKGVDFIIKCADILINKKKLEKISFLYCGEGPYLNKFNKMVNEFNLNNSFIFAGYREDIQKILPSCDIAIHASEGEAFSLSILEYMSAGCATIVPNNCGNGEVIIDEVNGFLYQTRDLKAAVEIMERLIADKKLREKIASKAQDHIKNYFSYQRCEAELINVLKPILNV